MWIWFFVSVLSYSWLNYWVIIVLHYCEYWFGVQCNVVCWLLTARRAADVIYILACAVRFMQLAAQPRLLLRRQIGDGEKEPRYVSLLEYLFWFFCVIGPSRQELQHVGST